MTTDNGLLRLVLIIVAAVLLVPFLMMLFMIPVMGFGHMWFWNGARGSIWPLLVFGLLCLIVIFAIVYLLSRAILGLQHESSDAALEALRQAYPRGDLTEEEFEKRRNRLQREGEP